jgi:phosphoribosylamine---glycine ligase
LFGGQGLNILVVGSGAREHTLVWKLARSPKVNEIYAAPGNAGIGQTAINLDIKATDFPGLTKAVQEKRIDLIVVGPEDPLAMGIVDHFQKLGIPAFGPTQAAAQLEASKVFSKDLMQKYGIPCAKSVSFSDFTQAKEYTTKKRTPLWIKADGLAAGKGAVFAENPVKAVEILSSMMESKVFGVSGEKVVIEDVLVGREMSAFVITDGKSIIPIVPACDYKRVNDGDQGPNTGGMGSYGPPSFVTPELMKKVNAVVMEPVVRAMAKEGRTYKGVVFGGLMIDKGEINVIEFNSRFGDPECQVILPRLESDLMDIVMGVVDGNLNKVKAQWSQDACVGVAIASGGYPGKYQTGYPITGLDSLDKDILVFHAATKPSLERGQVLTNGGRVLTVVARGKTLKEAREKVYANVPRIHFEGCHYRTDIALIK